MAVIFLWVVVVVVNRCVCVDGSAVGALARTQYRQHKQASNRCTQRTRTTADVLSPPVAEPSEHEQRKVLVTEHALKEQIKVRTMRRKKDGGGSAAAAGKSRTTATAASAAATAATTGSSSSSSDKAQSPARQQSEEGGDEAGMLDALLEEMKQFASRQVVAAMTAMAAAESANSKHKHKHKHGREESNEPRQSEEAP